MKPIMVKLWSNVYGSIFSKQFQYN